MKKTFLFLISAAYALFMSSSLVGQCVPDEGCVDINQPGEICPAILPSATIGQAYKQAITILAPDTTMAGTLPISIAYIVVDSVKNLPPGMRYSAYNDKFYPDTAYCIDIEGTPTTPGDYNLEIFVTPFILFELGGNTTIINGGQRSDDSSVVVTVKSETGINPLKTNEFHIIKANPNPFIEKTRLGYFIPFDDEVELKVFNILGELVHHEVMMGMHGENYFEFDGTKLKRGAYFYGITHKTAWHTGKFIKTE